MRTFTKRQFGDYIYEVCIGGLRDTGYLPFYFQGYRILSILLPGI